MSIAVRRQFNLKRYREEDEYEEDEYDENGDLIINEDEDDDEDQIEEDEAFSYMNYETYEPDYAEEAELEEESRVGREVVNDLAKKGNLDDVLEALNEESDDDEDNYWEENDEWIEDEKMEWEEF